MVFIHGNGPAYNKVDTDGDGYFDRYEIIPGQIVGQILADDGTSASMTNSWESALWGLIPYQ